MKNLNSIRNKVTISDLQELLWFFEGERLKISELVRKCDTLSRYKVNKILNAYPYLFTRSRVNTGTSSYGNIPDKSNYVYSLSDAGKRGKEITYRIVQGKKIIQAFVEKVLVEKYNMGIYYFQNHKDYEAVIRVVPKEENTKLKVRYCYETGVYYVEQYDPRGNKDYYMEYRNINSVESDLLRLAIID